MTTPSPTPAETTAALEAFAAEFPTVAQLRAAWKVATEAAVAQPVGTAAWRAASKAEDAAWEALATLRARLAEVSRDSR